MASFSITSGVLLQKMTGGADSYQLDGTNPTPMPLRPSISGDDVSVSPFVGGNVELMTPAVPMPTRPRFFVGGEILPTFGSDRGLAQEGAPGCVRGPEPNAPCAVDETVPRTNAFGQGTATGQGTAVTARVDTLTFGANAGFSFPLEFGSRDLRIKPSFAWINYKLDTKGVLVAADCEPNNRCTDVLVFGSVLPGFLREELLKKSDSRRFNGIGPGLDIEMDTGKYGPLGVSLYAGARAYYILGDRSMSFSTTENYNDAAGVTTAVADYRVAVERWMYRGHVGIRFSWLGND